MSIAPCSTRRHARLPAWATLAIRWTAWAALIGVTGMLVRAEARRPELPRGVEAFTDIVYRRVGDRRAMLDLYLPAGPVPAGGRPVVLAIHGGGWRGGSKNGYGREIARLAQHGYAVASAGYLLSRPEMPGWPENFEDVREAVRWLRRNAADFGIDPDRVVALGASAGGHLAALLGTYPDGPVAAEGRPDGVGMRADDPARVSARVRAVVNFYGPTDLIAILDHTEGAGEPIALLLGGAPDQVPGRYEAASPARHVSPDDPPVLLLHGRDDRLIPPDQSDLLASALAGVGVPHRQIVIEGAGHGFGLKAEGRDLLPEILDFLADVWKDNFEIP